MNVALKCSEAKSRVWFWAKVQESRRGRPPSPKWKMHCRYSPLCLGQCRWPLRRPWPTDLDRFGCYMMLSHIGLRPKMRSIDLKVWPSTSLTQVASRIKRGKKRVQLIHGKHSRKLVLCVQTRCQDRGQWAQLKRPLPQRLYKRQCPSWKTLGPLEHISDWKQCCCLRGVHESKTFIWLGYIMGLWYG